MDSSLVIVLAVAAVLALIIGFSISARKARKEEIRQRTLANVAAARSFWRNAEIRGGLVPVETTLMLKPGEQAYFCERAELMEPRAVRTGTGSRVGVRVTRGVWVSTGSTTYESNDVWKRLDEGLLTITNRRIVFDGQMGTRNLDLSKLVSVNPRYDGIEVSVENRQRSSGFTCANPLMPWMVANVCARFPDPSKWDGKTMQVDFTSIEQAV